MRLSEIGQRWDCPHLGRATRMAMWFHMATGNMLPWRIYLLCLIVYKPEPHNRFITVSMHIVSINIEEKI
ncbi:hypothetical protein Hanom_Chr01g00006131 [Helianthus anomalus]